MIDEAIRNFAGADPTEGPIVQNAIRFVEQTEGRFTPWAEMNLGEDVEGLRSYTGQDFGIFAKAVESLRLVYSPRQQQIPEVFTTT